MLRNSVRNFQGLGNNLDTAELGFPDPGPPVEFGVEDEPVEDFGFPLLDPASLVGILPDFVADRGVALEDLLHETEAAIKANDQPRACALVHRYGTLDQPARPVFDLLLKYAISEDGALHAEIYYRTVSEEFAAIRPAFRWRQLAALARVTASEHGFPAPGVDQARQLLRL